MNTHTTNYNLNYTLRVKLVARFNFRSNVYSLHCAQTTCVCVCCAEKSIHDFALAKAINLTFFPIKADELPLALISALPAEISFRQLRPPKKW